MFQLFLNGVFYAVVGWICYVRKRFRLWEGGWGGVFFGRGGGVCVSDVSGGVVLGGGWGEVEEEWLVWEGSRVVMW